MTGAVPGQNARFAYNALKRALTTVRRTQSAAAFRLVGSRIFSRFLSEVFVVSALIEGRAARGRGDCTVQPRNRAGQSRMLEIKASRNTRDTRFEVTNIRNDQRDASVVHGSRFMPGAS